MVKKAILKPTGYRKNPATNGFKYQFGYTEGARRGRIDFIKGLANDLTRHKRYNRHPVGGDFRTGFSAGYNTQNP